MGGDITIQQERLADCLEEFIALIPYHYDEVCIFDKTKTKLKPDWSVYFEMEITGRFFMMTCRKDGKMIGYYTSFLVPHTHYKDRIVSQSDTIFIKKEYRKGLIGLKLIRLAEEKLREIGVNIITLRVKTDGRLHRLMDRLEYKPFDTTYFKEI